MPTQTTLPWTTRLKVRFAVGVGFLLLGVVTLFLRDELDWWIAVLWILLGAVHLWDVNRELHRRSDRALPTDPSA